MPWTTPETFNVGETAGLAAKLNRNVRDNLLMLVPEAWTQIPDLGSWDNLGNMSGVPLRARRYSNGMVHVMGRSQVISGGFGFPVQVGNLPWTTTQDVVGASYGADGNSGLWIPFMVFVPGGTDDLYAYEGSQHNSGAVFGGVSNTLFAFNFHYISV